MKLQFNFTNGAPPAIFEGSVEPATPIELRVSNDGNPYTRQKSLELCVKTLDYTFRGVSNFASGSIAGVVIDKPWFGKIEKEMDVIRWNAISDKTFVVIYDIGIDAITEHKYVADAITVSKRGGSEDIHPVWIKELMKPKPDYVQENMISSIAIATEFSPDYRLVWGYGKTGGITVIDKNNKPLHVDDIPEDEYFILIKLLTLIVSKGMHMGVFLIDCKGFSDHILKAFTAVAQEYFGDSFIFLYNLPRKSKVKRKVITVPNFLSKLDPTQKK